ncbi:unnamed protein product [Mytilus coruscus]|uniref:DDE Tnp4 domain-containing protein n=1 Tax=Mytilus coruscus TaxID=42192 RepID=A0A6J8E786_MYTCO|nr:unnamed protein product [Mytilus coruscus]
MANFRLLAAMDEEIEDELLFLSCYKDNSNSGDAFNFDELSAEACKKLFRLKKMTFKFILAYPSRLSDLKSVFGRSETAMSIIINTVLNFVYDAYNHLLHDLNSNWLSHRHLQEYADAVAARDAPLLNCWGFIDGTVRPLCRPTTNQRILFNGHKRVHAIKFQSIVAPNGLVANMYGPIEGRRHDAGLLRESGICGELPTHMTTSTGDIYAIYGDPAYPMTTHIIKPFRGGVISAAQTRFNKKMSAVRTCVEWTFGKILTLFAFLDYKKNLKLYLQPVGKYYLVGCNGTILVNCHTCLYGSETGHYFDIDPPSLENYLSG